MHALKARLQKLSPVWAVLPCALLFLAAIPLQSRVVSGVRFFWLDDDQMISMRYARNLVEGLGLVFNRGERVEGYTNPAWTVVMALVHLLPIGESKIALAIKAIEVGVLFGLFAASARLLATLGVEGRGARALLFLAMAQSIDVAFWAFNGFETPLLALLFTTSVIGIIGDRRPLLTALAVASIPLVRSDGYHLSAALFVLAGIRRQRKLTFVIALAMVIPAAHVLWRRWYYGDWLPNTFYLKVVGLPGRLTKGTRYAAHFFFRYAVPVLLAGYGAFRERKRELVWLQGVLVVCVLYVLAVGGDAFVFSRFFAPILPCLLVAAVAAVMSFSEEHSRRFGAFVLGGAIVVQGGVHAPSVFLSNNGNLPESVLTGLSIRAHTDENATIAVITAGAIPYFSHRRTIDLLGKVDRVIARSAPKGDGPVGHLKYDYDAALERKPDFVVSLVPFPTLPPEVCAWNQGYELALPCSRVFADEYSVAPIRIEGLTLMRVYARRDLGARLGSSWP